MAAERRSATHDENRARGSGGGIFGRGGASAIDVPKGGLRIPQTSPPDPLSLKGEGEEKRARFFIFPLSLQGEGARG